jgi:hypothetical protein
MGKRKGNKKLGTDENEKAGTVKTAPAFCLIKNVREDFFILFNFLGVAPARPMRPVPSSSEESFPK